MRRAVELGESVRGTTSPNPWVGCVVQTSDGVTFEGATQPPGGPHAEAVALRAAGDRARGATMWVTLEPCAHHGRTPPCAEAIVAAGVARVVVGMLDPDANVAGRGIERLRAADVDVHVVDDPEVAEQLAPYVKHRRTGRPWIVLKLASSLDGRTAAPDGTSQWITSPQARLDAHRLRAIRDADIVGAGTVRVDDPALTARSEDGTVIREPLRVVLGHAPPDAKVHPCVEMTGDVGDILDELGRRGVVQAMVEGGATVAGAFHRAGAVDRYVAYLAPALVGGQDAPGWFRGPGAATISEVWRGRIVTVRTVGPDLRVELAPCSPG
jgi:diaminohydroxyphosphoribosylaminopyrimidine deaminase/5-amino-6-(5-phosphoribosylamino)uracil reductase